MPPTDYRLSLTDNALKQVYALPSKVRGQIERTIDRLLEHYRAGTRPQDTRPIRGLPNTFRIDSGEYRVVYEHDAGGEELIVFRIAHRSSVYRGF